MPKPYKVLCTLPDGVRILEPVMAPTHFEPGDVRRALERLRKAVPDAAAPTKPSPEETPSDR